MNFPSVKKNNNVCIIPARGGSKRIPLKNIVDFLGKPIIFYTIEAAKSSGLFGSEIYVSSDSQKILNVALKYGVKIIKRPKEISGDKATLEEASFHLLGKLPKKKIDYLCLLMPSCPLRNGEDIQKSYNILIKDKSNCLMSVVKYPHYPFWALQEKNNYLKPFFKKKYIIDSKLLPKNIYCPIGAIRWVEVNNFLKERTFYGVKLAKYIMPLERSSDIDTYEDIELAKKFYKISQYG